MFPCCLTGACGGKGGVCLPSTLKGVEEGGTRGAPQPVPATLPGTCNPHPCHAPQPEPPFCSPGNKEEEDSDLLEPGSPACLVHSPAQPSPTSPGRLTRALLVPWGQERGLFEGPATSVPLAPRGHAQVPGQDPGSSPLTSGAPAGQEVLGGIHFGELG